MLFFCFFFQGFCSSFLAAQRPSDFQYISKNNNGIYLEIRYATANNFMGRVVQGYNNPQPVLTQAALNALRKAQQDFNRFGYALKVFDAYRPQRAVDDFVQWIAQEHDTLLKKSYYPSLKKSLLIEKGYIARRSGHSRGSTVDVTLVYFQGKRKGQQLDMGGPYDFFGKRSNYDCDCITFKQQSNRKKLRDIMIKNGFLPYDKEWWHFTLKNEPYPKTYFNF